MRSQPLIILAKLAFFAAVSGALWFALTPSDDSPGLLPWDKALHFVTFYAVTLLAIPAFPRAPLWLLAGALLGFGGAIEGLQALPVIHRDAEWGDVVADALGVAFALSPVLAWRLRTAGRALAASPGGETEAAPLRAAAGGR